MARTRSQDVFVAALLVVGGSAALACSSPSDGKRNEPKVPSNGTGPDAGLGAGGQASAALDAGTEATGAASCLACPPDAARVDARTPLDVPPDAGASDGLLPPLVCAGAGSRFATGVVAHAFGPGQNVGQEHFPEWVFGPPEGASTPTVCQGATTNVVSLGNGGFVELEFAGNAIVDGPGPDFIVFENAFAIGCDAANIFAELATVSVSDDGVTWTDFPCTATKAPYGACAGTHVVYANSKTNTIDPTDPSVAGGDPYDLADLGVGRARFVRITDRVDLDGMSGVFDLDAVSIVHPFCP